VGFGLDIKQKPIEVSKDDWVEYKGVLYHPNVVRALKAWDTRRKNKETEKYKLECKDIQRKKLIKLMNKALVNYDKNNIKEYSTTPSILLLESSEIYFLKELGNFYNKKNTNIIKPFNIYIPNNKQSIEIKNNISLNNNKKHTDLYIEHQYQFKYTDICECGVIVLPESYYDFFDICKDGNQEKNRSFRHGTWIKNIYPERFEFAFIWADYCGAFSKHMKDIELTFKSKLLSNHSIFALTFSTRDPIKKKTKYSSINNIIAIQDFIKKTALEYGYTVEFLTDYSGIYKHHMYIVVFECIYEPIEKNKEQLTKLISTYYDLHNELKNRFNDIKRKIFPRYE